MVVTLLIVVVLVWFAAAVLLALAIGRAVRIRDEQHNDIVFLRAVEYGRLDLVDGTTTSITD